MLLTFVIRVLCQQFWSLLHNRLEVRFGGEFGELEQVFLLPFGPLVSRMDHLQVDALSPLGFLFLLFLLLPLQGPPLLVLQGVNLVLKLLQVLVAFLIAALFTTVLLLYRIKT